MQFRAWSIVGLILAVLFASPTHAANTKVLAENVTTASAGVAVPTPSNFKTLWIEVAGTGSVLASGVIYAHRNTDVSNRVALCVFTLSGTTRVADICRGSVTANPPYMSVEIETITGTDARFLAEVHY
jgi:hypothetical protein